MITVCGVGYRLCDSEAETVSAPDQVTDLYRELARHRVERAIDRLGGLRWTDGSPRPPRYSRRRRARWRA